MAPDHQIVENMTTVTSEDGFSFAAFAASPAGGGKGGLVILQEIFGMTEQLKAVARSYAKDGFEVILPGLFDRVSPATVVPFDQPEQGRDLAMSLDPGQVRMDVAAALKQAGGAKGASLLGFCWGGGQVLRLASLLDMTCGVAYYGTALKNHLGTPPKCPLMFHFGETDSHSPPDVIEAVGAAIPSATLHIYAAGHAFANDARATFVEQAAVTARARTLAFLNRHHAP